MRQLRTPSTTGSPSVAWLTTTCIAVLAAVQVACGSPAGTDAETGETPSASASLSTATEGQVPQLEDPDCDDVEQGSPACAAGFVIDDIQYALSCGAVRPEVVTEQVLARGSLHGDTVEVRSAEGVSPRVLVVVSVPGGCDDVVLSPWSLAFPAGASQAELDAAICAVVVKEHRERNHCG